MVRCEHSFRLVLLRFYSTTNPFQTLDVPNANILKKVHSIIQVFQKWCSWAELLLRQLTLQRYLVGFFSSLHTPKLYPPRWMWNCPTTPYWEIGLTLSILVIWSDFLIWSDYPIFQLPTSYIVTILVYRIVLILILLLLSRLFVNFLLFWSVHSPCILPLIFTLCQLLLILQVDRENSLREASTFYYNSHTSYVSDVYLLICIWDHQI